MAVRSLRNEAKLNYHSISAAAVWMRFDERRERGTDRLQGFRFVHHWVSIDDADMMRSLGYLITLHGRARERDQYDGLLTASTNISKDFAVCGDEELNELAHSLHYKDRGLLPLVPCHFLLR